MEAPELLSIEEVTAALKITASTLKRLIREGEFPEPIHPTDGSSAWYAADVTWYVWKRTQTDRLRKPDGKAKKPDDPLDDL